MPKSVPELSDAVVRRLRHRGAKAAVYAVGGVSGLLLVCKPPVRAGEAIGARSWILRVMMGSKRRDIGLGGYPTVTLAQARHRAREARETIWQGSDPIADRKARKSLLAAEQAKQVTFAELAREYIDKKSAEFKSAKQVQKLTSHLETYAFPHLEKMVVGDIERAHVVKMLEPIWAVKNETASRVRLHVERILDLAGVKGLRTGDNPARWKGNLALSFPARAKVATVEHYKALPVADMPEFWRNLKAAESLGAKVLQFIILTASRSGEARGATWDEVNLKAKLWTIPASRMKGGREHKVPLSDPAIALLESLPRLGPHIFTGPRNKPISDVVISRMPKNLGQDVTTHGFRATFRTWVQEHTAYPEDVAELSLAHVNSDATRAAYARGELVEKRRLLMADWAKFCETASTWTRGNVVAIGDISQ
jgi:integrase